VAAIHLGLAILAAIGIVTVAILALVHRRLGRSGVLILDRAILVTLAVVAVAVLSGLVVAVTVGGPADPLHFLYGLLALAAVPISRSIRAGDDRRIGSAVVVGALIALGAVIRLFMTGS
jgi:hypothetical protein